MEKERDRNVNDPRSNKYFRTWKKTRKFETGIEKVHMPDNSYKRVRIDPNKIDFSNPDELDMLNDMF